jgi:3-methyladenine DNA glycosylase AlkD
MKQATAKLVREALRRSATPARAAGMLRFFKTGQGQYGEGDRFIGVTVPDQRRVARSFRALPLEQVDTLLTSPVHEERLTALLILVDQFNRTDEEITRRKIFRHYMRRLTFINNWDLVDASAEHVVGGWLADKSRAPLYELAVSKHLWSRRVAILATFHYIKRGDSKDALRISAALLHDRHDLIHKAVGWMLREVGKRVSQTQLRAFLERHAEDMPRTMLRYAIERFPPAERTRWMRRAPQRSTHRAAV